MNKLSVDIGASFGSPFGVDKELGDFTSTIISVALVFSGIIVLFLIILGGIAIISGAGSNNPEQVAKGKQTLTWAVLGFIIVFAAYWIIRIIEIITDLSFITSPAL